MRRARMNTGLGAVSAAIVHSCGIVAVRTHASKRYHVPPRPPETFNTTMKKGPPERASGPFAASTGRRRNPCATRAVFGAQEGTRTPTTLVATTSR